MLKKSFLLFFAIFVCVAVQAQSASAVFDQYLEFNLAKLQGQRDKALDLGEKIVPNADKLPEKSKISFYFSLGNLYEDNKQVEKATPFYEKVAAASPDYYVVHRALGYIYLHDAENMVDKLNASKGKEREQLTVAYRNAVRKALPHLEKAQACDPSDETLKIIKTLYKNIEDKAGLSSLDGRLKDLAKHCIDILPDN